MYTKIEDTKIGKSFQRYTKRNNVVVGPRMSRCIFDSLIVSMMAKIDMYKEDACMVIRKNERIIFAFYNLGNDYRISIDPSNIPGGMRIFDIDDSIVLPVVTACNIMYNMSLCIDERSYKVMIDAIIESITEYMQILHKDKSVVGTKNIVLCIPSGSIMKYSLKLSEHA